MKSSVDRRADLEARRRSLSLDALEGVKGSLDALEEVEAELTVIAIAQDRERLAREEEANREARAEEARQRAAREANAAALRRLARRRMKVAAAIEEATEALVALVTEAVGLGDEMDDADRALGGHGGYDAREALLAHLCSRFWDFFPYQLPRAPEHRMRPLTDMDRELLSSLIERNGGSK